MRADTDDCMWAIWTFRCVLLEVPVSSFLAGLLASPEPAVLARALQLAQLLMEKLPDVFRKCELCTVRRTAVHSQCR